VDISINFKNNPQINNLSTGTYKRAVILWKNAEINCG